MNRELRRMQKKADEKQTKLKQKKKSNRLSKIQNKRKKLRSKSKAKNKKSGFDPNRSKFAIRMAAPFTVFTAFFIGLQALVPPTQSRGMPEAASLAIEIAYYLFFGHFLMIWLFKRKIKNGLYYAIAAGIILTIGLQLANYFVNKTIDYQVLSFGALAATAGALTGNYFYKGLLDIEEKPKVKPKDENGNADGKA